MPRTLTIYRLGTVGYDEALGFQRELVEDFTRTPRDAGALILLEHPPILTIGRGGTEQNILVPRAHLSAVGVEVRETNRGGDVTYHGPGQIVGYPILPLEHHGKDVHKYLRRIESVLMAALWEYNIKADRKEGFTGVWTPQGKIASIGIAISHWVSYHGFALNVSPNMEHFRLINPCGLVGVKMASMESILGRAPERAEVEGRIIRHFMVEFGFDAGQTMTAMRREERP